jgi:hypothetical protein
MTPNVKAAGSGAFADSGFFFSPQATNNRERTMSRLTTIQIFFRYLMRSPPER